VAHSFQLIFAADAASSALFALIAVVALPADRPRKEEGVPPARVGSRTMLLARAFMYVTIAVVLITFVYYQQLLGVPLRIREVGLSNADFGLLLMFNGLLVVLFELPISSITMPHYA